MELSLGDILEENPMFICRSASTTPCMSLGGGDYELSKPIIGCARTLSGDQ